MTPTPTDTSPDLDALNMLQRFQEINYDIGNQDAKGLADESLVMRRESLFASLSYILLRTSPPAAEQPDERTVNEKDLRRRVMAAIRSYGISHQVKADIESRTDGVMIVLGEYVLPFVRKSERESGVGLSNEERAALWKLLFAHAVKIPLSISSTRRSGENGLRNVEEVVCSFLNALERHYTISPKPRLPDVEDGASS